MKQVLKYLFSIVLALVVAFYFWGSSSNLTEDQLLEIVEYDLQAKYDNKDTFSIMTYNIGYLSGMTNNLAMDRSEEFVANNLKNANELIAQYNPDFIGFQEIDFDSDRSYNVNQMKSIAEFNGYNYGALAVNWDKNYVPFPYWPPSAHFSQMLSGQGVISKYPVISNSREILVKPESNPFYYNAFYLDRLAQISKIKMEERYIIIINVHLEAFAVETREKHAETVIQLYRSYAKDHPVLLIGDFNSIPPFASEKLEYANDLTMQVFFEEEGLAAAIPKDQYLANESKYFTFDSRSPNIKIDYIFYNENKIAPLEGTVLSEAGEISDHLPVFFKFVIK